MLSLIQLDNYKWEVIQNYLKNSEDVFVGSLIITKFFLLSFLSYIKNIFIIIVVIKVIIIIIIINRKILGFILGFFFFTITTSSSLLSLSNPNLGSSFVPLSLFVFNFGNRIRYMTLYSQWSKLYFDFFHLICVVEFDSWDMKIPLILHDYAESRFGLFFVLDSLLCGLI